MVILTVFIAPVGEELIFRSALISGLRRKLTSIPCIILSGFAFSIMHMNPAQTVYQFALGCSLGALALCSKSVIPCIVCHATSNLIACFTELIDGFSDKFFYPVYLNGEVAKNPIWIVFLMLVAISVVVLGFFTINKRTKNLSDGGEYLVEEPVFFDQTSLLPVFKSDLDYEEKYKKFLTKNNNGSKALYDEDMQQLLKKQYEATEGECGGIFGKNTFVISLAVGIGFCIIMWFLALATAL